MVLSMKDETLMGRYNFINQGSLPDFDIRTIFTSLHGSFRKRTG